MVPRLVHIVVEPTTCTACGGGDFPSAVFLRLSRAWEFAKRIPGATVVSRQVNLEQTSVVSWVRRVACHRCITHRREDLLLFGHLGDAWRASQELSAGGDTWIAQQLPIIGR